MTHASGPPSHTQDSERYLTRLHDGGGKAAIILLHGFQGDAATTWGDFPSFLARKPELLGWDVYTMGYDTALFPDILRAIWSADAGLETLAGLLRTTLTLGTLADYEAVALVAHSMGGLIAQRALLEPDVRSRVTHLFLFGTPSAGLVKAWLVRRLKSQFRDMSPDSAFLTELRRRWAAEFRGGTPFKMYVMAGENDQFVPEPQALSPFPESTWNRVPGNHVQMVKPKHADDLNVLIVTKGIVGGAGATEVWNAASVAAQDRRFRETVERLWPKRNGLDQAALVDLALALEKVGRPQDAVEALEQYATSTDGMGTLAGRLKRRWLADRQKGDADKALELYSSALALSEAAPEWEQAFYHAINVAFMELAYRGDRAAARAFGQRALDYCGRVKPSLWSTATGGEAHLYLGDREKALEAYRAALQPRPDTWSKPDPWQVTSMYDQAMEVAERFGDDTVAEQLTELFRGKAPRRG